MVHMEAWLNKVDEIAAEGPSYKLGHDGAHLCGRPRVRLRASRRPPTFSVVDGMLKITYEEEVTPT